MRLYKFSINEHMGVFELELKEFEVEEKNKTYQCKGRRFSKTDIGHVSGYYMDECLLLENNPSKAASILLIQKEKELQVIGERYNKKNAELEYLKTHINV